jgi:hypothetical protein
MAVLAGQLPGPTIIRPSTGTTTRPVAGTTTRPALGITARPTGTASAGTGPVYVQ